MKLPPCVEKPMSFEFRRNPRKQYIGRNSDNPRRSITGVGSVPSPQLGSLVSAQGKRCATTAVGQSQHARTLHGSLAPHVSAMIVQQHTSRIGVCRQVGSLVGKHLHDEQEAVQKEDTIKQGRSTTEERHAASQASFWH